MGSGMNLSKLAKLCNVSPSTVSAIFNRHHKKMRISEDTFNRVIAIAKKYESDPLVARLLARAQCSNIVGVIVPDLLNYSFSLYLNELEAIFTSNNIQLIIACSHYDEKQEISVVTGLLEKKVDALLVFTSHKTSAFYDKIAANIPVVLIDRCFEDSALPYVITEAKQSSYQFLVEHVPAASSCFFVGADLWLSSINDRFLGFSSWAQEHGFDPMSYSFHDDYEGMVGAKLVSQILERYPQQEHYYLFCSSYIVFLGVLSFIKQQKLSFDKFTLLVFDSLNSLALIDAQVHYLEPNYQAIARLSFHLVDKLLDGETLENTHIVIPAVVGEK